MSVAERFPTQLVIGGEQVNAAAGKTFGVENPATEQIIAQVAEGDAGDVDRAVSSARAAFEGDAWRGMSARQRGAAVSRLGELIVQHKDELARLETLNNGKPLFESAIDVNLTAETFKYYGGWADKVHGETIPVNGPYFNYTLREPLGVIGAIVPWNFPMSLAAWKIAPALACGNTVVLKPATQTPFTAIRMAELGLEAGLPPGVFNCVPGEGKTAGMALVRHPQVDKIAFTGSTEVGKMVMREAAATVKKLSLELGGKSPNIVYADADLDAAARGALTGIFYGKGEVCAAGSRLLVEESVREALTAKILERAKKMVAGDPLNPKTRLGAIVSKPQMESVLNYIKKGKDEGAQLLTGGEIATGNGLDSGFFYRPTIFGGVEPQMRVAQEEIFGPTTALIKVGDFDEAIRVANGIRFGLSSSIFTRDVNRAFRAMRDLEAGITYVNAGTIGAEVHLPFGGTKDTGNGHREAGQAALDVFTEWKSIYVDYSGKLQKAQIDNS